MPTEKEYMAKKQLLDTKQDKLTAGTNITISPSNVISATGGGSNVSVTQKTTQGENIADIRINGVTTRLYAPGGGLRNFVETENTLYGKSITSLFKCGLSQYYFNTTVTQEYTNGDIFEKANNTPAVCLCTNFKAIGNYYSGGTIIISPNPLGVSFNATLDGVEYNTTYADTPSGDIGNNRKYEKGTYTDSDNNIWYWASIGGGGWQLVPVDGTIPFLTLENTGWISNEMDEIFATIEPEIFYPYNGIARNNNLAFFAGASDPTGADAPIKIYADGTYEGIGGGSDVSITPTLSTGTKIADYSIDGTSGELYAPTGGGGTGNVDDVYVNGTSVLDSNHIAQIKSYKELTQAEYDALPSSKLTDDIMYCITDAGVTEGDTFAPIIYSLEEREVGTWTDGKPLYKKTIYNAGGVSGNISILHSITNLDKIIHCEGTCYDGNGEYASNSWMPFTRIAGDSNNIGVERVNSTNIRLTIPTAFDTRIINIFITVYYTKTTDTPGSAQYTPLGVPAVHYSTDEQVIGTWIDGSTIYETTFEGLSQPTNGDQWVTIQGVNVPNIKDLIDCKAWGLGSSNEQIKMALAEYSSVNDGVRVSVFSSNWNRTITKLTIQYTKTTS
jgi:hypothetical protein